MDKPLSGLAFSSVKWEGCIAIFKNASNSRAWGPNMGTQYSKIEIIFPTDVNWWFYPHQGTSTISKVFLRNKWKKKNTLESFGADLSDNFSVHYSIRIFTKEIIQRRYLVILSMLSPQTSAWDVEQKNLDISNEQLNVEVTGGSGMGCGSHSAAVTRNWGGLPATTQMCVRITYCRTPLYQMFGSGWN